MGFDPERAVRQQFVDSILGACATRSPDGFAFGWHFTHLGTLPPRMIHQSGSALTVVEFECGSPLRGYTDSRDELLGPHRVRVYIEAIGQEMIRAG